MKIEADFSGIKSSFEPLPDGDYECVITEVEMVETKANKLPMLKITLEVDDPQQNDFNGRLLFDNIVLKQNDGKQNKIGLGKVKAYAEATLGEEEANSPEGIDPESFKGSKVTAVVKLRSWTKPATADTPAENGVSNDIKKIVAVG